MSGSEKAIFAAGCFWGVEHEFKKIPGVLSTKVGYSGGEFREPSYEQVCSGQTGHAECVLIEFDPNQVEYKTLVEAFFALHDPTQKDRQGPDIGTQYRSAIFFTNENQKLVAEQTIESIQKRFTNPVVTTVIAASDFWDAEKYHQNYFEKHGL